MLSFRVGALKMNLVVATAADSYNPPTPTPPPPPPRGVAKTGKNHLNEEIISLLSTGIGESFCKTKFRTWSALAPMWTPPINESAALTRGGPLVNSLLWE